MNLNIDTALEAFANVEPLRKSADIIEISSVSRRDNGSDDELTPSERFVQEIDDWARRASHANGFAW